MKNIFFLTSLSLFQSLAGINTLTIVDDILLRFKSSVLNKVFELNVFVNNSKI